MLYLGAFTNIYVSCSAGSKHDVLYKKGSLHDKFWRSQHPLPLNFEVPNKIKYEAYD